jgi:hypothetical protein
VKDVTDNRVKGFLGNGLVEGQEKPAEDGHGKSPSHLLSFGAADDLDPEEDKPGSRAGEKQEKDNPE